MCNGYEVARILEDGMPGYVEKYGGLPFYMGKVVESLQSCRTEKLGSHSYACDHCDYVKHAYNSCRNRHCPKCQGLARVKWVDQRLDELLPTGYYHVVFTIPSELYPFGLRNKKACYNILQQTAADTLNCLSGNPKYLGAKTGFISVLHTWGQNMTDHPHVHCIIPDGGLKDGKKWVKGRGHFLFPIKVMSRLFKGKFLDAFKKGVKEGTIKFHGVLSSYLENGEWPLFLTNLYKKEWVVYCKPPFGNKEQVIKYLGGYTHRIAVSNQRIVDVTKDSVSFKWKDYAKGNEIKTMVVTKTEFIRRFLLHVLPRGYKRIRYYGFLSNRLRKPSLKRCFELLGKPKSSHVSSVEKSGIPKIFKAILNIDITLCPECKKGHLHISYSTGPFLRGVF